MTVAPRTHFSGLMILFTEKGEKLSIVLEFPAVATPLDLLDVVGKQTLRLLEMSAVVEKISIPYLFDEYSGGFSPSM